MGGILLLRWDPVNGQENTFGTRTKADNGNFSNGQRNYRGLAHMIENNEVGEDVYSFCQLTSVPAYR
jgi:hypothetical protein